LNLQKRTVSESEGPSPTPAASDAKASPFGGARPIDTATKEREIEEKRQLALRLKREQDEKAKEERRLAKDAAKAEKPVTAVSLVTKDKENGGETPPSGKSFEILRKAGDEGDVSEEENEAEQEKAPVVVEKLMKPREMKNTPPKRSEGAWRKKSDNKKPESSAEQGAQAPEEPGWSTVSKPKNSRRGGHQNQAARAIAS
jgi:translation initiation factor 4B